MAFAIFDFKSEIRDREEAFELKLQETKNA